jgi:hypothetical protein
VRLGMTTIAGVAFLSVLACPAPRDVIPESHDVQGTGPATTTAGYEYVARRPLAVIAIAESRGLPREVVTGIADRLANALDACATELASHGRLVPAAARIAAHIDRDGAPTGLALTLTPGPGPTANALVCFVSPFKLLHFPAADADPSARGLAVEAAWGASAATGAMTTAPTSTP